ncbi:MAG TPA: histidine phosphatase family protein [Gammaproteobacteria bacterium]
MNDHGIIDLLRHGETTAGKCFLGSTNAALTDKGWSQMHNAVSEHIYDMVITSPLLRCVDFARDYSQQRNIPLLVEEDLREIHFGLWEGKTSEQLWQSEQKTLVDFWKDPFANTPPQGEAMTDFVNRVNHCFNRITQEFQDKRILLVAHAGVIKVIISSALGILTGQMHKITIDHGGISRFAQYNDQILVNFINRI